MTLTIKINSPQVLQKVQTDKFGRFVSNEWKWLMNPYTPRDTALLMNNVDVLPWRLHYRRTYSAPVYHMKGANFKKKNPFATYEWDKAAESAGQKNKLYRTINNYLTRK